MELHVVPPTKFKRPSNLLILDRGALEPPRSVRGASGNPGHSNAMSAIRRISVCCPNDRKWPRAPVADPKGNDRSRGHCCRWQHAFKPVRSQDSRWPAVQSSSSDWKKALPDAGGADGSGAPRGIKNGLKHGWYTEEARRLRSQARRVMRDLRAMLKTSIGVN
jgi:hypothetical protein